MVDRKRISAIAKALINNPPLKYIPGTLSYEIPFKGPALDAVRDLTPSLIEDAKKTLAPGMPFEIYVEYRFEGVERKSIIGWYTHPMMEDTPENYDLGDKQRAIYRALEEKYVFQRLIV